MSQQSITIRNARVFDGTRLSAPRSVFVNHGVLSSSASGGEVVECDGATLLPGLIDSHVHLDGPENLKKARFWGVTTLLDMGTQDPHLVDRLRNQQGLSDVRRCGRAACSAGSFHATRMGYPVVNGPEDGRRFVDEQLRSGADYIKIILDDPNRPGATPMAPETIAAIAQAAHECGRSVVAHAIDSASFQLALENGVDVMTHTPMGETVSPAAVDGMARRGLVAVPTLVMMKGLCETYAKLAIPPAWNYRNAQESVARMRNAGIAIVAGTDANADPWAPFHPELGPSLHEELELLVEAGLTPLEALRCATSLPAASWGLTDRGSLQIGCRADLVLVEGDPTLDIRATRAIRAVWVNGARVR